MTLKEAFYKQKDELHEVQRANKQLEKALEKATRDNAADEQVKKLLSQNRGLKNKVSEANGIADRYKTLYENEKKHSKKLQEEKTDLEFEVMELKNRLERLSGGLDPNSTDDLKEAHDEIAALKDEVARLTARLDHDSTNTGTPTSKTRIGQNKHIPNSRGKSDKSKGGQTGHKKHDMPQFSEDEITDTVIHDLMTCPECGSSNLEQVSVTYKDEFDYEVKVIKRRHKFIEYVCLDCGKNVRAPLNGLVAPNQYGSVIQAMGLSLMNVGVVSVNRSKRILTGLSPDPMTLCEGYLIKLQKRYSKKLRSFVSDVKKYLVGVPILYWDDTVIFINTSRACMRFYGDGSVALYTAHPHKDLDGIMADNILPALSAGTIVMHDHNSINYHISFIFKNVECLQHLLRDLKKLADDSGHKWPVLLSELITSKIHERKQLKLTGVQRFSKEETDDIMRQIRKILEDGYKEYIAALNHYYEDDERALLNRLESYEENYFAWLKDFNIPTTNNLSERALRFAKTKDKISGQFESVEYASYFADIRTYLGTCTANGINEYTALLRLTQGNPFTLSEILSGA